MANYDIILSYFFKANFHLGLCLDHSIAEEEYEGEDYDDVDEDLKAQILGRNEAEQEEQTTAEEGQLKLICILFLNPFILPFVYYLIYNNPGTL